MGKVRMYHAASDRYQWDAAENFEAFHQPEGWVIVDDEDPAPVVGAESVAAGGESTVPPAEAPVDEEPVAETPKRGRSK